MIWEKNGSLNCDFEDLFQPIHSIELIESHNFLNHFIYNSNNNHLPLKSKVKKIIYSYLTQNFLYFDDKNIIEFIYNKNYWEALQKNLVIHSCIDFYSPELQNAYLFKPVSHLQSLVDKQVEKFSKLTSGIHIRRTDNAKSLDNSSTDLFLKLVAERLRKDDNQLFFLATDDRKEEELFKAEFGNKIITQENKDLSRNSKKGIEDAIVDLYSLSKTNHIYGSFWSSFSITAAGLNKIPLTVVVNEK